MDEKDHNKANETNDKESSNWTCSIPTWCLGIVAILVFVVVISKRTRIFGSEYISKYTRIFPNIPECWNTRRQSPSTNPTADRKRMLTARNPSTVRKATIDPLLRRLDDTLGALRKHTIFEGVSSDVLMQCAVNLLAMQQHEEMLEYVFSFAIQKKWFGSHGGRRCGQLSHVQFSHFSNSLQRQVEARKREESRSV